MPRIVRLPPPRRRVDARSWDAVSVLGARAEARVHEAEALAARVEAEVDAARRRGEEEGRAAGASRLSAAAVALETSRARLATEAEPQLVELALALARALVGDLALRERGVVLRAARQVLQGARGRGQVVLRAHPDDLPALRKALAGAEGAPELQADPSVERGGAIALTAAGLVDGTVAGRLERLGDALRRAGNGVAR